MNQSDPSSDGLTEVPNAPVNTQVPKKADGSDMDGRFREILSDPLNLLIQRHPMAGTVNGENVYLHNGLLAPIAGDNAYYDEFSKILTLNRGVHEPLEEYVFQQMIKALGSEPTMFELGAYWGHYSMWLKHKHPSARVVLVEPREQNLSAGMSNFQLNGFQGEFINAAISKGAVSVDGMMDKMQIPHLQVLHADIQGYEVEMLEGCANALTGALVDYMVISTHSQELHKSVIEILTQFDYRIEVSSDVENQSTSFDGLIFASSPRANQIFEHFEPLGRIQIARGTPEELVQSLSGIRCFY